MTNEQVSGGASRRRRSRFLAMRGKTHVTLNRIFWLSLIAASASLLAACGSNSTPGQSGGEASSRARSTTPFQARMLSDGKISFTEYRRATSAVIRCLKSGPVEVAVSAPERAPGGELDYTWSVRSKPGRLKPQYARANRRFERCHSRYEDDVKLVYSNQRVIPAAKRPAVLHELVACLRGAGLEVPDQPPMPELIAILDRDRKGLGTPCADRYADFFRVPAS